VKKDPNVKTSKLALSLIDAY